MKTVQISLNSIDKVKSFVNDITKFDVDFDLVSGRYVIDAKSIMGIFSLDLSKPIDLNIHAENDIDTILAVLKQPIIMLGPLPTMPPALYLLILVTAPLLLHAIIVPRTLRPAIPPTL